MLDATQLVADPVHGFEVVGVDAQHLGPGMRGDVHEVVGREAVVDRHQHGSHLGHGVKRLELLVRVRRDVRDTVPLLDAHRLQGRGPPVAAREELFVGQPQVAIDHPFAIAIQLACPSRELERCQRGLHLVPPMG